jgi:hypothetical protein
MLMHWLVLVLVVLRRSAAIAKARMAADEEDRNIEMRSVQVPVHWGKNAMGAEVLLFSGILKPAGCRGGEH